MGNPKGQKLSDDGLFVWRPDLYVWEPTGQVPMGTETPDGRFRLTKTGWVALHQTLPAEGRVSSASAIRALIAGLAIAGGAILVGFILLAVTVVTFAKPVAFTGGKG